LLFVFGLYSLITFQLIRFYRRIALLILLFFCLDTKEPKNQG
jgi:hypothetical protein